MVHRERIVYISKATFAGANQASVIEPEIGRILMQSRRNNPARGLVGALYYGDGHFFQVLEGESTAIDALLATLRIDPRHQALKVLSRTPIDRPTFAGWSMKYVAASEDVKRLLASFGQTRFDPYRFDEAQMADMVALLQARVSASERPAPASTASPPAASGDEAAARMARLALAIGGVALALAVVALVLAWRH
jgi:hypothetical protein